MTRSQNDRSWWRWPRWRLGVLRERWVNCNSVHEYRSRVFYTFTGISALFFLWLTERGLLGFIPEIGPPGGLLFDMLASVTSMCTMVAIVVVAMTWAPQRVRPGAPEISGCYLCGFSLEGLPVDDPRLNSVRCPECGARSIAKGSASLPRAQLELQRTLSEVYFSESERIHAVRRSRTMKGYAWAALLVLIPIAIEVFTRTRLVPSWPYFSVIFMVWFQALMEWVNSEMDARTLRRRREATFDAACGSSAQAT